MDAWVERPQAARLADIRWQIIEVHEGVLVDPSLAAQTRAIFEAYQGQAQALLTKTTGSSTPLRYNLSEPAHAQNFQARQLLLSQGEIESFSAYYQEVLDDSDIYRGSANQYSTIFPETYNYYPYTSLSNTGSLIRSSLDLVNGIR